MELNKKLYEAINIKSYVSLNEPNRVSKLNDFDINDILFRVKKVLMDEGYDLNKENNWISIDDKLPIDYGNDSPHYHKLWIKTKEYGPILGFYANGKFMSDYASEIVAEITHYIPLPR